MIEKTTTASGSKAHQRSDNEDRSLAYRNWHRELDKKFLCSDVDIVEWRFKGGDLIPVAVMEITRVDGDFTMTDAYLAAILQRINERDLQGRAACYVAEALAVQAWLVAFRYDLSEFWVYNLSGNRGWWPRSPEAMAAFIWRLGESA